jgi:hypothetical protein
LDAVLRRPIPEIQPEIVNGGSAPALAPHQARRRKTRYHSKIMLQVKNTKR